MQVKDDRDFAFEDIWKNNAVVTSNNFDWVKFNLTKLMIIVDKTNTTRASRCAGVIGICARKYIVKVKMTNSNTNRYSAPEDDKEILIELYLG